MRSPREIFAYATLSFFLVFVLSYGVTDSLLQTHLVKTKDVWDSIKVVGGNKGPAIPDFSRYEHLDTLSAKDFPSNDPTKRIIITGDIHGMMEPFEKLLKGLKYNPNHDILVHVGDILAKGPHQGSLAVLKYMAANNITGVRGNHDQKVIEWRGWHGWISSLPGGRNWLERLHGHWNDAQSSDDDINVRYWVENERSSSPRADKKWWKLIPEGWVLFSDHYLIAKDMSESEFQYLLGLPLRLYVPSAHVFIVHAGMLPSDPRFPYTDKERQPLARVPTLPDGGPSHLSGPDKGDDEDLDSNMNVSGKKGSGRTIEVLRNMQEIELMTHVSQNQDPWVALNMRSIMNGEISKGSKEGEPWSKKWKREMGRCVGYYHELEAGEAKGILDEGAGTSTRKHKHKQHELPCYPSTVIYGHAAARGLDLKRWSIGLDSGCVYQRKLSALIIGGRRNSIKRADNEENDEADDADDEDPETLNNKNHGASFPFGDQGRANIFSVGCP